LGIQAKKIGRRPSVNVVVTKAVPDNVRAPDVATVTFDLVIALNRGLRSEKAGTCEEILLLEKQADRKIGKGLAASGNRITQHVYELQIFERDVVGVPPVFKMGRAPLFFRSG